MRISDWSSDVCSSDLKLLSREVAHKSEVGGVAVGVTADQMPERIKAMQEKVLACTGKTPERYLVQEMVGEGVEMILGFHRDPIGDAILLGMGGVTAERSEEHTSELQSLMHISYAVF